jgi:translocation and assembly module TamB
MTLPDPPMAPVAAVLPAAPPAPRSRWRRALVLAAWVGLLPLALLCGAGLALYRHAAPLAWLLDRVPGLSVQGLSGSLASGGLRAIALDWTLPDQVGRLRIDGLSAGGWSLSLRQDGAWRPSLRLATLHAERLQFSSGPPSATPLQPPADLQLPATLQVDRLGVDELHIDALPVLRAASASLTLGAGQGAEHRVDALSLQLDVGHAEVPAPLQVEGSLAIGSDAPLPVQATLRVGPAQARHWQAELSARGPLQRLAVEARLSGDAAARQVPSLDARATLLPFAAWPLAELTASTQALDLSLLSPRLPTTLLAGRAQVSSSGMDRVAVAQIEIDNSRPGAWDRGALPLRRLQLQASGEPRQTDRLTLDRFELQLADAAGAAGRIQGRGRWQGENLALALQLDDLRPARLDRRAAALQLGGTLTLEVSGLPFATAPAAPGAAAPARRATPQVTVDGQLDGRLLDGSGQPVRLRLAGDASASHLRIRQAEARSGAASAHATLEARAVAAGWQLRGEAVLAAFDPRPWWPGPAGSAWRRGPHQLDARLDADLLWRRPSAVAAAAGDSLLVDRWLAQLDGSASLVMPRGQLAGVPLNAELQLRSDGPSARVDARAELGGNRLALTGRARGAAEDDAWQLDLQAPALTSLAAWGPLFDEWWPGVGAQWPRQGAVTGQLRTQGRWPALQTQGELQARGLANAANTLASAQARWSLGRGIDAPLQLQLQAQGAAQGDKRIDHLDLALTGTPRQHQVTLSLDSPARPPAWAETLVGPVGSGTRLAARAQGAWQPGPAPGLGHAGYRWSALTLHGGARDATPPAANGTTAWLAANGTTAWLAAEGLGGELRLDSEGRPESAQLAPGRLQLLATALNWREARWQAAAGAGGHGLLAVSAELETIPLARVLARVQPDMGWTGDLTLGGRIEIQSAATTAAELVFQRLGGDLALVDEFGTRQSLGLTDLHLALTARDGVWQFAQGLAGSRIGTVVGAQVLRTSADKAWPTADAPLQGVLEARVADLGAWGAWVPPGWRLSGQLETTVQFGGRLGAPEVSGTMRGNGLGLRSVLDGIELSEGELSMVLEGDHARIERLSFKGGEGTLSLTGEALLGEQPSATLALTLDRFRALGRVDRRLLTSGQATLRLERTGLRLDGDLRVDEGLFDLSRGEAPRLDDDVIVRRRLAGGEATPDAPAAAAARPVRNTQVTLRVDLGDRLRLRGFGVDTRLRGELLVSAPEGKLALNGVVSAYEGRYVAYGQRLEVSRGELTFVGPLDNPRLDVLAIRPNLDVIVGVEVTGTAIRPRVRLYSDPEMPDTDKLSWLMMGRAPDALGSTDAAMVQRAAFALLAGNGETPTDRVLSAIGLTDFSVRPADGSNQETVVTVGKQISRRWYVGFERGVNATTGNWQVIYRIAQSFTLRAQTGQDNSLDLIWTWRW